MGGCRKDEDAAPVDLGLEYFPTRIGHYVDYQVDSAWRDDHVGIQGSVSYVMREVLTEETTDAEGRPAQRIERYVRDSAGVWQVRDVWTQTRDERRAERTEENLRMLKMVFPPRDGQFWDLNIYNTEDPFELTYEAVDVPWSTDSLAFDSTSLVESTFFNNLVDTMLHEERYAKHVGLVYKRWVKSNTQSVFQPPFPPIVETKGNYLTMKAIGHGQW
jgi:hypothetical protein